MFPIKTSGPSYKKDEKFIALIPYSGFCNRLRSIYSYYQLSLDENKPFVIIWRSCMEEVCVGNILDYYEKIPNVDYIIVNNKKFQRITKELNLKYMDTLLEDDFGTMKYFNCISSGGVYEMGGKYCGKWTHLFKELNLKDHMQNIINTNKDKLGKYIAIHIRRTDHVWLAKYHNKYTCDDEFINFINKFDNNKNIYIATDNEHTYNKFKNKYPNRIKFNYHKTNKNSLRKTSLEDAIIDIYMCVYSDDFMGSGWSSFSDLIKSLRI